MLDVVEDVKNEFKVKLTDKLEICVIAFLNTNGGDLYLGVNDKGEVVGLNGNLDILQRKIKDRIKDNISPSVVGLYNVELLNINNKSAIRVSVKRGKKRPYYLRGLGMTPESCFMRVGSSIENMPTDIINNQYYKCNVPPLTKIEAPTQSLSFSQIKIYYEEKGYKIEKNFNEQLHFYTEDGKYNMIAYLLSDYNDIPIRFGKYSGTDAVDLIENENYGNCSIIKATKAMLEKLKLENKTFTKIEYPERKEINLYDYEAVREAVINAFVHNDWSKCFSPKFEIFSDKLVISSVGGLQENIELKDFFDGKSLPRNPELMKVFCDLKLVENMGTGIKRILKTYDKSCFNVTSNSITVSFDFNKNEFENNQKMTFTSVLLSETQKAIVSLVSKKPKITQDELANILDINVRTVQRNIKHLLDLELIYRVGSDKKGEWRVNEVKKYGNFK